ncbi:MAG TPA: methyltransferase domain-containing protein [Planctomycetota bacterium]|nr:methyltransferase domain-containing protein [Planctomycetota bacterium]HRR80689.1 methyltransferase domain-containing protein [Planctomycetota bacterium]HRT93277.1 methyltransferase domain-containing protein [Planctomycetota bacterium]
MKRLLKRLLGPRVCRGLRSGQRMLLGLWYRCGNRVECPICGHRFSKFLPFGGRENDWCPSCLSLGRHRLLYLFLRDRMAFFRSRLRVLHFAPERCLAREIRRHPAIEYVTADLMVSFIHELCEAPDLVMSITHIGFGDETFDVVIANHVLEQVEDDRRALREVYRVLRPGGYAILQVDVDRRREHTLEDPGFSPEERARHFGFSDEVRLYGLDYRSRLEDAGFAVAVEDYVRHLDAARHALDEDEVIYVCRRHPGAHAQALPPGGGS